MGWFSYMDEDKQSQLTEGLQKTADLYNVPIEALQLGRDFNTDEDAFKFLDLPDGVQGQARWSRTLPWFGRSNPKIELPKDSDIDQDTLNHEMTHLIDQYLASLNADGTVREEWTLPIEEDGRTLTGYDYWTRIGEDGNPYLKDYNSFDNKEDRYNFFYDRFMGDTNNRQRDALKDRLGSAVGHVLSDPVFHDSSLDRTDRGNDYDTDSREKWANAKMLFERMRGIPEDRRFLTGTKKVKVPLMTPEGIEYEYPGQNITSVHTYEDMPINPELEGMRRMSPETFKALQELREEYRINKAGDGFSKLEILKDQRET